MVASTAKDPIVFALAIPDPEITYKDALKHADAPNDLRLTIKLSEEGSDQLLSASRNITFDGQ